jgi:Arc/MetJ-type ribon-helix-helix transcriptional regulator
MEFQKVTISLPVKLITRGKNAIQSGWFSNFSDLVRGCLRAELRGINPGRCDFDDSLIYEDKDLIAGVKQSEKEFKAGKGITFNSTEEMEKYFEAL